LRLSDRNFFKKNQRKTKKKKKKERTKNKHNFFKYIIILKTFVIKPNLPPKTKKINLYDDSSSKTKATFLFSSILFDKIDRKIVDRCSARPR
jgi:hypothetical protein